MPITPEILDFLKSPKPDFSILTRKPGGSIDEWQEHISSLVTLARKLKPLDPNCNLALDQMANRRPYREVSFHLSPPDEEILLRLRIIEPGKEKTLRGIQRGGYLC